MSAASAAALDGYIAIRHRLPPAAFDARPVRAETLGDVAGPYDAVLLDAYGVLNRGEAPIPGAVERVAALRAAGKAVMVVSNSAGYPKPAMMARYARLGFDFAPHEVLTSREVLLDHLGRVAPRRWGMMLSEAHGTAEFEDHAVTFLGDDPEAYAAVEGFLLVGSDGWTEGRQALLEAALRARPRPVVVGNPDMVAPREDGLSREPGHYAHQLADRLGIAPVFLGKPFPRIFEMARARLPEGVDPARVLMVGDTLHTDVLGGRQAGLATALVTGFGSLAGLDVEAAIARSGIVPDFVVDRP